MNSIVYKAVLAAVVLAGSPVTSYSQTFTESWQEANPPVKVIDKCSRMSGAFMPLQDVETYNVTCRFEVEGNDMPTNISVYNKDFSYSQLIEGASFVNIQLPEGEYDFLYECKKDDRVQVCVVKEDVSVSDNMEISFSADEASTKVMFHTYGPDGELFRPDRIDRNYNIIENGNTDYTFIQRVLVHKDCGIVSSYFGDFNSEIDGAELSNPFDFLITDVSDEYILAQARLTVRDGVYYVNKLLTEGVGKTEISNNWKDFVCHEEKFNRINPESDVMWSGCRLDVTWNGIRNMGIVLNEKTDSDVVRMYLDNRESNNAEGLDLISYSAFADDCLITVYDLGFGMTFSDTTALNTYTAGNMITNDGKVHYVNTGHAANGDTGFQVTSGHDYLYLPGHEAFGFTSDMTGEHYMAANTTPFVSLQSIVTDKYFYLAPVYIGQFGEVMTQDDNIALEITHDNDDVTGDYTYSTIFDFCSEWTGNGAREGIMKVSLANDNILINGEIPAHSEAVFSFDLGSSDPYAPTLQMLQIHDGEGHPDNFLTNDDGEICIAAGDFNYTDDDYYECGPVVLHLFYRPSGTDEWTEMTVTEHPEMFRATAFGYYYTAHLSDVGKMSESGWFDLRVTCSDEAGNTMDQTMCCAMYIASRKSLEQSSSDDMKVTCLDNMVIIENADVAGGAVYSSDGKKVMEISEGQNVVMTDRLDNGVYLLECSSRCGKHFTCKILIN